MNDLEPKNLWLRLKCLWQGQKPSGEPALTADEQIAAMRKKMAQLHRGLNKTDFLGLAIYGVTLLGIDDPTAHYKGKTIRVSGVVIRRDDRPYIEVHDPGQIELVS